MDQDMPQPIYLKDYQPPDYLIEKTELRFELGEQSTIVFAKLTVVKNPAQEPHQRPLDLDGEGLKLKSVHRDQVKLTVEQYQQTDTHLQIPIKTDRAIIETEVEIFPDTNTSLEGLFRSNGIYCTQCEAQGFRNITYFLDRPDVMSEYVTTIVAHPDRCPVMLSNGNRIEQGQLEDGRVWISWHDPYKKPSYLFALVAGDLCKISDVFCTQSKREVMLEIYVESKNQDKCTHAMQCLKKAMLWDEQRFGLEYDLDTYMIVAVDDFNMGAMENKGLNVFNSKFVLAKPDTATDVDYAGIEGVIAHEYFHNWTGNRVTCRDWFQLSLKEGLTVFRDQEFSADMQSRAVKRIEDVRMLRTLQFAEDASPMSHPVRPESYIEINNFYTVTIYEKGAEVIRMMHSLLGEAGFQRGMQLYFARHDGQAVTCDDFVAAMADANDADLTQFKLWYMQSGTPKIDVQTQWDASKEQLALTLSQSLPTTSNRSLQLPMCFPVKLGLLNADGEEMPLVDAGTGSEIRDNIIVLKQLRQTFRFVAPNAEPQISLFREFSAPVKIQHQRSLSQLSFLASHDNDAFNRWEAGQLLWLHHLQQLIQCSAQGLVLQVDPQLPDFCLQQLHMAEREPALAALMVTPPSIQYLAESLEIIQIEALEASMNAVRTAVASELCSYWQQTYFQYQDKGKYEFNSLAVARRSLKNLALNYWVVASEDGIEAAQTQVQHANNMTDCMASLSILVNEEAGDYVQLLEEFYQQWQGDALVLDKWFSLQAGSRGVNTFARVKELVQHQDFNLKNPNRVRSLLGAFSRGNLLRFHDVSGEPYQFFADQIIQLNGINPQIAARLLTAFGAWRRYASPRKENMCAQLKRIIDSKNLSADVYEIASSYLK